MLTRPTVVKWEPPEKVESREHSRGKNLPSTSDSTISRPSQVSRSSNPEVSGRFLAALVFPRTRLFPAVPLYDSRFPTPFSQVAHDGNRCRVGNKSIKARGARRMPLFLGPQDSDGARTSTPHKPYSPRHLNCACASTSRSGNV